jgi:hypothetical protein
MSTADEQFKIAGMSVRKAAAIYRADVVDATHVVFLQMLAGSFLVHDVAALVVVKIFLKIFFIRHVKSFCRPFHFGFLPSRENCFAAVGAFQAVNFVLYHGLLIQRTLFLILR